MLIRPPSVRTVLLDDARTCSSPDAFRANLRFLASIGVDSVLWHFSDDQGCRIAFDAIPGIGTRPCFSVHETRTLINYARDCGITLIPELATLGHSRFITRLPAYRHLKEGDGPYSGMCPVHPETRDVFRRLLTETIELFDPPAVHVGLDEVEIGEHPLTAAALKDRSVAELIADHVKFVRSIVVEQAGREMWMWADGMLAAPDLMKLVPRDVVACNWQYTPTATRDTTQTLLDAGFDVLVASAILSFGQTLFPSDDYALANIRQMQSHAALTGAGRVRGHLVTTWIPSRSVTESQRLAWHLAADMLATGDAHDRDAAVRDFGRSRFGLADVDAWADACRRLLAHAPQRAQWLAVVKLRLEDAATASLDALSSLAAEWRAVADAMQRIRADVRSNLGEFDALRLIIELLDHAYAAAAALHPAAEPIERSRLAEFVDERAAMLAALSASWDGERFSDDPAKTRPVIHFFRDDHLLLIVEDGLDELQARLASLDATDAAVLATNAGHS